MEQTEPYSSAGVLEAASGAHWDPTSYGADSASTRAAKPEVMVTSDPLSSVLPIPRGPFCVEPAGPPEHHAESAPAGDRVWDPEIEKRDGRSYSV